MNYFAHGRNFVDDPYFLAGTAVPDWLSVVDRKIKARSKHARALVDDADPLLSAVARGVVQHHADDDWFHRSRAFTELSLDMTVVVRDALAGETGMRPHFLGHILVELLLDAALIEEAPQRLDAYYAAIESLDPRQTSDVINRLTTRPSGDLSAWIVRFSAERFLYDYTEDAKLLIRLNQVMRRVRLPQLPDTLAEQFPEARRRVKARRDELLTPT